MKVQILTCTILAILTITVGFDIFIRHTTRPPDDAWQYLVKSVADEHFDDQMDKLGGDGWEVVSARRASNGADRNPVFSYELILKRHATPERVAALTRSKQLPLPERK
jgi:hypothetical protein